MKKSDDKFVSEERDAVEALLGQARPRPVPAAANEQIVREAVHAEWRAVTGRRSVRRRALQFAAAAAIVLALAVGANLLKTTGVRPVEVAAIDKQHGSVYVLGQQSERLVPCFGCLRFIRLERVTTAFQIHVERAGQIAVHQLLVINTPLANFGQGLDFLAAPFARRAGFDE